MLKKLKVPTRHSSAYLSKYLNRGETLDPPVRVEKRHIPYFTNVLCKFFMKNKCTKGTDCIFSHDRNQAKAESEEEEATCKETEASEDGKIKFTSPFH